MPYTAAQLRIHQEIVVKLGFQIELYLQSKACKVYVAPFGVRLLSIEVLSPSTALFDMNTKHNLYERHGIREHWLIHPEDS